MDLIEQGIQKGLISFSEDKSRITYLNQNKSRNYNNPEEKVQAETFLKLVLLYNYPANQIRQFETVTMGSSQKEADIIVYNDEQCEQPHIVVECKKEDVSELEFIQAKEQAASYAYALAGTIQYIWVTSKIKNDYVQIDKESKSKRTIPDIPHFGITEVQKYKYVRGGRRQNEEAGNDEIKQNYFDLEQIGESELQNRFKQAHQSLWAGGELNPSEAFDELDKLIFCKIWDERKPRKIGEPYDFQVYDEPIPKKATDEQKTKIETKKTEELYKRILALYAEGKKVDQEVFKDNIRLNAQKIRTVVSYLEGVNLTKTDLDAKGRAFETFMGSYFRGDFGQYFTPRPIVEFIVNVLPIKNDSKVLDTSCGSGGFLLYALNKVREAAKVYYPLDPIEHHNYWHDFASKKLYGIEINEQIARTAKMNMIIHDDGHTNVISADGLLSSEELIKKTDNKGFKYNDFDFIVTNPPFGSAIKQTEKAYLHQYKFGNKDISWLDVKTQGLTDSEKKKRETQNTEVLFIEQCYKFLKEDGFLAIVIPDGILTNSTMQYVRDSIEEWYRIVAVISLPQTAFTATGAGVKSSVLFLRKWNEEKTERIKNQKLSIQERLKKEVDYLNQITNWEAEKKQIIKNHTGFVYTGAETDKKQIEKTPEFSEWKKEISENYSQRIKDLQDDLEAKYLTTKQKELDDYDIFMAIAENIGYDATGKETGINELDEIGTELAKFIDNIVKTEG